jgi:phage shock protein C
MLAGVAGGLARVMDADPSIIRVVWVVVTVLSGGIGLLVYIVMAVVVPEAPDGWEAARSASANAPAAAPREPVPPGGWLGPDGTVVPHAGTAPGTTWGAGVTTSGAATSSGMPALAATTPPTTPDGWTTPPPRASGDGRTVAVIIGAILILVGGAFLVREFMPAVDLSTVWPVISIGFGVLLLILAVRPRRTSS